MSDPQTTARTLIKDMLERAKGFNASTGIYNGRIMAEELLHWAKKLDEATRNV